MKAVPVLSLILAVGLFAGVARSQEEAAAAANEKEQSGPTEEQKVYLDFLTEEGFRPRVDDDGDIGFKFQGGDYFIIVNKDEQFFQLIFPAFWTIDDEEERAKAFRAIDKANRTVKTGKIYAFGDRITAGSESYTADRAGFKPIFYRSLDAVQLAAKRFREAMQGE